MSSMQRKEKLCVAAVQMESRLGEVEMNLKTAARLIKQAASSGAELILLPEFFSCGYSFNTDIWAFAEAYGGNTVETMTRMAKEEDVWIGFTFLEVGESGSEIFNTFVLTNPSGVHWCCRKTEPAALEAFCFRGQPFGHVLHTDLGVIGIGICYENMIKRHQIDIARNVGATTTGAMDLDIMLLPHSAPTPDTASSFSEAKRQVFDDIVRDVGSRQASLFGVPTVMANKVGSIRSNPPWQFFFIPTNGKFVGHSCICKKGGDQVSKVPDHEEGIAIGIVQLGSEKSAQQVRDCLSTSGRHVVALPSPISFVWTYIMEPIGKFTYRQNVSARRRMINSSCTVNVGGESGDTISGWLGLTSTALMGSCFFGVAWYLRQRRKV